FLLEEVAKANPNKQAMFNALQGLSPEDRIATLKQLASQKTASTSDLDRIIQKMYGEGDGADAPDMANLLTSMFNDVQTDPSAASLFSQVINDMQENSPAGHSNADSAIQQFLNSIGISSGRSPNPETIDKLAALPDATLTQMDQMLRGGDKYT